MASREQDKSPDKAIDGLLRRSLARTAPSQDCPGPDILAAYYDRSLDSRKIAHYELHFSTCAHCRAQLAAMVRAGEPEAAKKEAGGWGWLTHRWWFVPALATAALALVVSVPLMRRIYQPVPTQVAMNAPARAAAPASDSERDEATSADTQLLDRASGKTAPHAAPTGTPEKKKDLRLAAPPQGESDAKSASPHPLSKTQDAGRTPAVADSPTVQSEPAPSAPASSVAARRAAPAQSTARSSGARSSGTGSSGAGAAGGFTAQNQVRQQNQRQNQQSNQPQNQQQNESTAQVQSQTVQVEAQAREEHKERQAGSASSGAIGGAAAPAPRRRPRTAAGESPAAGSARRTRRPASGARRRCRASPNPRRRACGGCRTKPASRPSPAGARDRSRPPTPPGPTRRTQRLPTRRVRKRYPTRLCGMTAVPRRTRPGRGSSRR